MVKNIDLSDLIKIGDKIDWIKSSQENKVIYCSTHCPEGYLNVENKNICKIK